VAVSYTCRGRYDPKLGGLLLQIASALMGAHRPHLVAALARAQLLSLCGYTGRAARRAWAEGALAAAPSTLPSHIHPRTALLRLGSGMTG
jgi:hypothetical protein